MANKVLNFLIKAKDETSSVLDRIKESAKSAFGNLANFKAGLDLIKSAATAVAEGLQKVWSTVIEAMNYETAEKKFTMLLHDAERAKELVKDMQELGETPPFSRDEFDQAAQALIKMGASALATKDNLVLFGDAAYATGASLQSVGDLMGFVYASIKEGQPLASYAMTLERSGLVTRGFSQELSAMQAAGESATAIWDATVAQLARYNGAMDSCLQTGDGLVTAIQGKWQSSVLEFGQAFLELAKTELQYVLDKMTELKNSGAITEFAERAKNALKPLVEMFGNLFDEQTREATLRIAVDDLKSVFEWAWERLGNALQLGADLIRNAISEGIWGSGSKSQQRRQDAFDSFQSNNEKTDTEFAERMRANAAEIARLAEERRARAEESAKVEKTAADEEAEFLRKFVEENRVRADLAEAENKRAAEAAAQQARADAEIADAKDKIANANENIAALAESQAKFQSDANYWAGVMADAEKRVAEAVKEQEDRSMESLESFKQSKEDQKAREKSEKQYNQLLSGAKDALRRNGVRDASQWLDKMSSEDLKSSDEFRMLNKKQRDAIEREIKAREKTQDAQKQADDAKAARDKALEKLEELKKTQEQIAEELKNHNDHLNQLLQLK